MVCWCLREIVRRWHRQLHGIFATRNVVLVTALLFVLLFFSVAIALAKARRREQRRFVEMSPFLARRYGLSANEAAHFSDWSTVLAARRRLPRRHRRSFDRVHAALARLALLHEALNDVDPDRERVLAAQLAEARDGLGHLVR